MQTSTSKNKQLTPTCVKLGVHSQNNFLRLQCRTNSHKSCEDTYTRVMKMNLILTHKSHENVNIKAMQRSKI